MLNESGFGRRPPVERGPSDEDAFYALIDTIDEQTRQTQGFQRIVERIEDSGEFEDGIEQLRRFVEKRNASLDETTIRHVESGMELDAEGVRQIMSEIRLAASFPERFLGNGATAEVYTLRTSANETAPMICAKVVKDYERYAEGHTIAKEMDILDSVSDLEVEGVRAPMPLFAFSSLRYDGYAMEHLDAVNFRRVLEGQTTEGVKDELPESFDVERYFSAMRAYVEALHARGVVHNDLYLRNMMVDRTTGLPRVIDFGKAKLEREMDKTRTSMQDEARQDLETIKAAEHEVRAWLASRKG